MWTKKLTVALERRRSRRRAGWRARAIYQAQRRAWLRENRRAFALVGLGILGFCVVFHLLAWAWPGDQVWGTGFVSGAAVAVFFALRQSPPSVVERWQEGAWGEEMTASELHRLPADEWVVLNDVRNRSWNFDHVVIGPAGVFCLNSKKSSSALRVSDDGGKLRFTNRYDNNVTWTDDRMLRSARGDARRLSELIRERTGTKVWVTPVIVWWGRMPDGGRTADRVAVVHGSNLVAALDRQTAKPVPNLDAVVASIRPARRRAPRRLAPWSALAPVRSRAVSGSGAGAGSS